MKLLIETCLDSYLVALIENNQILKYIFKKKLQKKSDVLAEDVQKILGSNVNKLEAIYVTDGPGSFMGVRAGLIYGYTLATTLNINFYTTSSLNFISNNEPGMYYIDARSGQSYAKKYPNGEIKIIAYQPSSTLNINKFLNSPDEYLHMFVQTKKLKANYLKAPKVG